MLPPWFGAGESASSATRGIRQVSFGAGDNAESAEADDGSTEHVFVGTEATEALSNWPERLVPSHHEKTADATDDLELLGNGGGNGTIGSLDDNFPTDIYMTLVFVSICLVVVVALCYSCYKAVQLLKVADPDAEAEGQAHNRDGEANVELGTMGRLAGIGASVFSGTLRSTASTRSDDKPPPYNEFPPSYSEAVELEDIAKVAKLEASGEADSDPQASTSAEQESQSTLHTATDENLPSASAGSDATDGKTRSFRERFKVISLIM